MGRRNHETALRAIRLEVEPADQAILEQKRQHVIAVLALVRRGIDFDPVAEAEQAFGAVPLP